MRIKNTDRFRNKYCKVSFKDGSFLYGKVIYIPIFSQKYNFHSKGWFLENKFPGMPDVKLNFKEIYNIEPVMKEGDARDLHYDI